MRAVLLLKPRTTPARVAGCALLLAAAAALYAQNPVPGPIVGGGSGSGSVTVVAAGSLTSTGCVTGGGSQTLQTPSANCTVDSSGNLVVQKVSTGGASPNASGIVTMSGVTSGSVSWAAADVAGTAIAYILPATNGTTGQLLQDTGSTSCPTLPSGSPATCHLMGWLAPGTLAQNSKSAAYTTVLSDAGKQIYHPSADTTARTWTIDSNANVAYPVGTIITFVNDTSGGVITISITSDTLVLAGAGTTGNRTLAASGYATATKITSTRWMISGSGLT